MPVDETLYQVSGGPQIDALRMAGIATEWRVYLVVTDQAIGHLRQGGFRD